MIKWEKKAKKNMQIKGKALQEEWTGETLAIGIKEGETKLEQERENLDKKLGGIIEEIIRENEFEGKVGKTLSYRIAGKEGVRKIILVGLGKEVKLETIRNAAATIAKEAKNTKSKSLGISLPIIEDQNKTAQAITEGILLALHQDNRFKSSVGKENNKETHLETIDILGIAEADQAITKAQIITEGVILARELVAAPANIVNSITMAETAEQLAKDYGLTLNILEQEDCEKLGMGAFLGVAKASDLPPKFIHLIYTPETTPKKKVAIVGKSLTFDSGGLNIKGVGSGIENMKIDMGGGGATLGTAKAIAQLKPAVEVHFICAVTENMISGKAMHPGDILTASNGKTIEINNTDAEGRLTLADALVFAEKLQVEAIVDLATLTGACVVALGDDIGGLWSTNSELAEQIKQSSVLAGEKFWQMPMEERYLEGLKSPLADLKNTGPRTGGAITAALFLKEFINSTPWVHLDIAGPVWADKAHGINNVGATGFPVRTLVNWVLSLDNS